MRDTEVGIEIGGHVVNNFRYADDTVYSQVELQCPIDRITIERERLGLKINNDKKSNDGQNTNCSSEDRSKEYRIYLEIL